MLCSGIGSFKWKTVVFQSVLGHDTRTGTILEPGAKWHFAPGNDQFYVQSGLQTQYAGAWPTNKGLTRLKPERAHD
jgi:hypothetical protein